MAGAARDYSLDEEDIDRTVDARTVRILVKGECYGVYRKVIFNVIKKLLGDVEIESISKRGSFREWFVSFVDVETAERLSNMEPFDMGKSTFVFADNHKRRIFLKVHWLPRWIKNRALAKVFEEFGKILSIKEGVTYEEGMPNFLNGVRELELETTDSRLPAIPHIVSFNGTLRALVTCRGRLPLCLRCNTLGHKSDTCSFQRDNLSYASKVKNVEQEEEQAETAQNDLQADDVSTPINNVTLPPSPAAPIIDTSDFPAISDTVAESAILSDSESEDRLLIDMDMDSSIIKHKRSHDSVENDGDFTKIVRVKKGKVKNIS